ncbi:MAG: UDP-N-acetylmuramoyl-L-alanyl-D-glutamate--2,6-diaminopimelate ligase [Chlorobiales bacterium]|nr:UDP-N-acetylmuramoyl-L-alanyl-D-glutamate--2,6-diaminopimelate ligase [Chlorobiales bacterium]
MKKVRLEMLLERLDVLSVAGDCGPETHIEEMTSNSRTVVKGGLFIAVKGYETDGHRYIAEAVGKGARIVVCEKVPEAVHKDTCYVEVRDSRLAMAQIAKCFYHDVSDRLNIIGVTGTNGKTTTARLMAAMMNDCGIRTGYIGTGLALAGEEAFPLGKTTPEAEELHRFFAMMAERGCTAVVMEASSHALALQRTYGIRFTGGIFTNLTQDHLDFHHTMENYAGAKQTLMEAVDPEGFVVVNADDPWAAYMAQKRGGSRLYCCTVGNKEFDCPQGTEISAEVTGAELQWTTVNIRLGDHVYEGVFRLPGLFNVMNLLEVFASGLAMGLPPERVIRSLSGVPLVEGRMEIIRDEAGDYSAVVDYAHTPDALEKVIGTLQELKPDDAELIVLFGCGGNRDRDKRPKMGVIASKGADRIIITSDNPRDEKPEDIIDDIIRGISAPAFLRFGDRAEAIHCGVNLLKKGDILLVAGKGHESYQESAGVRRHFSDKETTKSALSARAALA